ncbi:uncharacterized protein si:ch1073-291c23.2 isoform X3 [Ictalurus punctatus]|uniref:Uncharacterized protein si:ch1073-291c23.2 isoform X3 n=1 Tax=Ictalurus punctatus TaxID=7998 RepID=A0A2D0QEL2_ICTPU|nr:uncharacterized protein si:ch1073-291c23.2 isoform X3 [Ictalurus punctatus]
MAADSSQESPEMDTNADSEPTQLMEGPSTQTAGGTKPLHRFLRGEPRTVGYFICGILYIQSERNTTKKMVTISLVFSILAILGTIIGVIIFSKSLLTHHHYMMYPDFSLDEAEVSMEHYMQLYSLEAVFLFHSLVAGVILIAMSVFARLALHSSHTRMLVVMRYPPSAE